MAKKIIEQLGWIFVIFLMSHTSSAWAASPKKLTIRVAILQEGDEFGLAIHGHCKIFDASSGLQLSQGRKLSLSKVTLADAGFFIGEIFYPQSRIRIEAAKDISIFSNGKEKRYCGTIDIIRGKNPPFLVVNTLDIERYVKGVLFHEITNRWPMEATKAQAVAARTYALSQIHKNKNALYDVRSDIYSQVYGGKSAERYRTNLAVNRTQGEVLTFQGQVFPAYYHSHCGGHTETASELWKEDLIPLRGVACDYCRLAPNAQWKKNFRSQDIQQILGNYGFKLGLIKEIKVIKRTESGRVKKLEIVSRDRKRVFISGKDFREILGANNIKSNKFDIIMRGFYFDVVGQGWGHGVGLCQWGAHGMAQKKYSYKEILKYYYSDSVIVKTAGDMN